MNDNHNLGLCEGVCLAFVSRFQENHRLRATQDNKKVRYRVQQENTHQRTT